VLARRVFDRIVEARADQDNEQWHLLIMQDLVQRTGVGQSPILHKAGLRQIGHDERTHKLGSLAHVRAPRFHQSA
jgi:hypothetical protein